MAAALLVALLASGLLRGRTRSAARAAFPQVEGVLQVAGLDSPLEVLRDSIGVPHVVAQNEAAAYFGLGFVHAQDRLAQMLWCVRLARGRTAEVVGSAGLAADRLARTLDLGGVADREWAQLEGRPRELLEAYTRGVNARIDRIAAGAVAPPLALQGRDRAVERWRPADSLAVLKFYAWSLGASMDASLLLSDLLGRLGGVEARPFFPGPAGDPLPAFGEPAVTAGLWSDPLRRAAGLAGGSAGSSAWVLGGAHTASGRPLLAADAHLQPTAPPLLHVAHLRGDALDVAGATLPGVPIVWTGYNPQLAWASTHARAVVTDLYIEKLGEDDEPRYYDGQRWRPLVERTETIRVRGGRDQTLTVRATHHGPLVDGLLPRASDPLAIAWVGQLGGGGATLGAFLRLARAADVEELLELLEGVSEPALAVVYASADGAAGMQVAGWIPRRSLSTELVPVDGRARWFDWQGRIPFERLPRQRLVAGRGWAIAADNQFTYPTEEHGEWLWRSGVRARRIDTALRAATQQGTLDLEQMTALQADVLDGRGLALARAALRLAERGGELHGEAREVAELLRAWDGRATRESVGAAAYHAFAVSLTRALLERPLGDALLRRYLDVPQVDPGQVVYGMVRAAADGGDRSAWSDPERAAAAVQEALRDAWFQLSSRLGASRRKWRWGRLHRIGFKPFESAPGDPAASLGPFEASGSGGTLRTAEYAPGDPFDVRLASLYRFAIDAADLRRSLGALAPGQSEHPDSPHYADALPDWLEGRPRPLVTAVPELERDGVTRLLLEPAP